jgi:transposase-like protein
MLFVGVDWGEHHHDLCLLDQDGSVLAARRIADGLAGVEESRLCCLVLVGVRADGTKELVAVADGQRESGDEWAELLRDLRRRGMPAPVVMVGDGALGLWRALREVFPATREQRCWVQR